MDFCPIKFNDRYMHENAKGTRNKITSANRFGGAIS